MQSFTIGAGLAALAFWGFIATVVVAGVWSDLRKRESKQETIRRLFESGQPIDPDLLDRLLASGRDGSERLDRGFKLAAMIVLPVSVGLALFGLILGTQAPEARIPLLGISALVALVGLGLAGASIVARRWHEEDEKGRGGA